MSELDKQLMIANVLKVVEITMHQADKATKIKTLEKAMEAVSFIELDIPVSIKNLKKR